MCRDTEAEAQAAAAAAEVERNERAAAQGLSVQLKAEADRRAKVFHNAVKAGVAKVQAELEAERDSLEARYAQPGSSMPQSSVHPVLSNDLSACMPSRQPPLHLQGLSAL